MSAEATAWAKAQIKRRTLAPSVERILLAIAKAQPKSGAAVKMTYARISAQTRDGRSTVKRAIITLIAEGLLLKELNRNKQRQDANSYTLLRGGSQWNPERKFSEVQIETPETGSTVDFSEVFQESIAHPPNAHARVEGSDHGSSGVSIEEMEKFVWHGLKVVGGRNV